MPTDTPVQCQARDCTRPARMAVRTARPTRGNLNSTVYYDDRTAPRTAPRYCRACGLAVVSALVSDLVAEDAPAEVVG